MIEEMKMLQTEVDRLRAEVVRLRDENQRLVSRNLALSEQLDLWYEQRRAVKLLKTFIMEERHRMANADLRDDTELMAVIEARVETENLHLRPDFDAEALATAMGVTTQRLARLFRNHALYRSAEEYIDFRRVLSAMELVKQKPHYNIAAIAQEVGFGSVRSLQRRVQEAIGMTLNEYRLLFEATTESQKTPVLSQKAYPRRNNSSRNAAHDENTDEKNA